MAIYSEFSHKKMVMFHSYVSLPEGSDSTWLNQQRFFRFDKSKWGYEALAMGNLSTNDPFVDIDPQNKKKEITSKEQGYSWYSNDTVWPALLGLYSPARFPRMAFGKSSLQMVSGQLLHRCSMGGASRCLPDRSATRSSRT